MKSHRLLIYDRISRRMRGILGWLLVLMLAVGVFDQATAVLGERWWWLWVAIAPVAALWFFYAFVVRRSAIEVHPNYLRLRGPLLRIRISYGRIHAATTAHMGQHYAFKKLTGGEKYVLEPYFKATCLFVELSSYPERLERLRRWFPPVLFGQTRPGLLLIVEDWLALSRDIEVGRTRWQEQQLAARRGDRRTLAAQVLDF